MHIKFFTWKTPSLSYIPINTKMEVRGETSEIAKLNKPGQYQVFVSHDTSRFIQESPDRQKQIIEKVTDKVAEELFSKCNFTEYGYFKETLPLVIIDTPLVETVEALIPKIADKIKANVSRGKELEPKFLYHHMDLKDRPGQKDFDFSMFLSDSISIKCGNHNYMLILSLENLTTENRKEIFLPTSLSEMYHRVILITNDKKSAELLISKALKNREDLTPIEISTWD